MAQNNKDKNNHTEMKGDRAKQRHLLNRQLISEFFLRKSFITSSDVINDSEKKAQRRKKEIWKVGE